MPLRVGALASLAVFLIAFATLATSHGQRPAVAFSIGIGTAPGFVDSLT
ncbi:hypothetical protein J2S94_004577 [Arthrobacter bambusae]|nr:hypothetical protein [Arthrobacter bambusae]